ncbi:uncharacterized protein LOC133781392 [Humulus lupulus]|uniref:uncharacterized protein LOC133781392 n=1 Tax=Humulus lupulus TaxID=3486 RepID=UPI002B412B47|nr:uncharacterized protein LOC133781392 [Humulus lupulus]
MSCNVEFLDKVLCIDSEAKREYCDGCFRLSNGIWDEKLVKKLPFELNMSQTKAALSCLHMMDCRRRSSLELIWGPPGTGKTKTTSTLLVTLLRMNYKTLVCAPTNVAITEVASRVLKMVLDTCGDGPFCSLGNILLFGTKERLNIGSDLKVIYMDDRVEKLEKCFRSFGWRHSLTSMIDLLENSVSQYNNILESESTKDRNGCEVGKKKVPAFLQYVRETFNMAFSELKEYFSIICTHTAKNYISGKLFQHMVSLVGSLVSFQSLLCKERVVSEVVEKLFSCAEVNDADDISLRLSMKRKECVSSMRALRDSLNRLDFSWFKDEKTIRRFCLENASLILCTVSSSYKLHRLKIKPGILIIDEAAQLKECESTIPLQLPGVKHAILVGDEWQLPATVKSKVSEKAGFGRSLFERLSSQNHPKQLLNMQYRMHPSISMFPNSLFYRSQLLDAASVKMKSYERSYLPGPMFGSYSFINIIGGREQKDGDGRSRKNLVEVAVIMRILQKLYQAWFKSKYELSIGIVSPYAAQVVEIQTQLGFRYNEKNGFQVKVKTIDGFQGGEEDIIIMSTVRCSGSHSLDFISKPQRINVALTRARHCLWILGEERTLVKSLTVWTPIVIDAKNRKCFFNADRDDDLAKAITEVKKESGQFDDMIHNDGILFKRSKWKVFFSENFLKSFKNLEVVEAKKPVIKLLLKLSDGWRPRGSSVSLCANSLQIMSHKVEGFYVVSTVGIAKEHSEYIQVLKIWDLLPYQEIPTLKNQLDIVFDKYTEEFINNCNERCLEGKLEIPKSWPLSSNIGWFEDLHMIPMKFYSLSNCVVNHMLSDRDGRELDLPFEVPDQEREIILFPTSTFVLGRSGTGKTTVLSMKLFQKEYMHRLKMEGLYGAKRNRIRNVDKKNVVFRQLFVTATPKLCDTVKKCISYLRSGSPSAESGLIDEENIDNEDSGLNNIPDSFHGIPLNSYPLVITFHKFLMMLDGTLRKSYFQRFLDIDEVSQCQIPNSRSNIFHSLLRTKEVDYKRFCSQYWPSFDSQLTKKLDPSCVFTQIVSHIKGSLQALETNDGKLTRKNYVMLSNGCGSSLRTKEREMVYDIFQIYEKLKLESGEFDLADFVNDLHFRLRQQGYGGDKMNFVYIDEVQDLTMSQVALFKHVCSNLEEGFVFSGDVAKPAAGGIGCRIQDMRSVICNKFFLKPMMNMKGKGGHITNMFSLTRNFRSHGGILKLSESVIELMYRFFPLSIDIIDHDTYMVPGEAPILLQSEKSENAIIKLFGKGDSLSKNVNGFGAEQAILVRDETARQSIQDIVGKQALIITILECKDLEFQDVLLYNFFGSSPLRMQWSLIYKYMNEQDLLDSTSLHFPLFNESKHRILLAELKQLHAAISCTKNRLWICDDTEFSKPMFDYWMKKSLVQVQQLDDSLALSMQGPSSPQEWKWRGLKSSAAPSMATDNSPSSVSQQTPISSPITAPTEDPTSSFSPQLSFPSLNPSFTVKLDSENYMIWKNQILNVVMAQGLEDYLDGSISEPVRFLDPPLNTSPNPLYNTWQRCNRLLMSWLYASLTDDMLAHIVSYTTAAEIWVSLAEYFEAVTMAHLGDLRTALQSLKKNNLSITAYIQKLKTICNRLAAIGEPVSRNDHIIALLGGLGRDYNPFVTSFKMRTDKPSLATIHSLLISFDAMLQSQNALDQLDLTHAHLTHTNRPKRPFYSPKPPASTPPSSPFVPRSPALAAGVLGKPPGPPGAWRPSHPSSTQPQCQICGNFGHTALVCYHRANFSYQPSPSPTNLNTFLPSSEYYTLQQPPTPSALVSSKSPHYKNKGYLRRTWESAANNSKYLKKY